MHTIERIAYATGVRAGWLFTGEGPMRADTLPRRTAAVEIAREGGVSELAIDSVLRAPVPDPEQKTTLWWIQAILLRSASLQHEAEFSPAPPETLVRKKA